MGSGFAFCFCSYRRNLYYCIRQLEPPLFINEQASMAKPQPEDKRSLCCFYPCNEILLRLHEIFESGKKQGLTRLMVLMVGTEYVEKD